MFQAHLPALKIRKHLGSAATFAILAGTAVAGFAILPVADGLVPPQTFALQPASAGFEISGSGKMTVFRMGAVEGVQRIGIASLIARDIVTLQLYRDTGSGVSSETVPVLLQADARLLWVVVSDENKDQIRKIVAGFFSNLQKAFSHIVKSDAFRNRHQENIRSFARKSVESSISDPQVDLALKQALAVVDKAFDTKFISQYSAIIARRSGVAFLQLLADMPVIITGDINPELKERLKKVFDTAEGRELMARRLRSVLNSPESEELLTAFARVFLDDLLRDPEFLEELHRIAADGAFSNEIKTIEQSGIEALKRIAKLVVGVDHDDRMHPLAATILRNVLLKKDTGCIVAFVRPEQFIRLRDAMPKGVIVLEARHP